MTIDAGCLLPACRNIRDLGGLQARAGGSIRSGVLLRAGSPHDAEVAALTGLGRAARSLIDLRSLQEADLFGFEVPAGSTYVSAPFETSGMGSLDDAQRPPSLLEAYLHIALGSGPAIAQLFRTLADPSGIPAMVFCAAGKDRTGVAIALVLGTLGVPDEEIAADYARTGTIDAATFPAPYAERVAAMPDWFRTAPPATMLAFLDELRSEYGTIADFVRTTGVREGELAALDLNLLTS